MYFTNPKYDHHKAHFISKIVLKNNESLKYFDKINIDRDTVFLDENLTVENYYFFSISYIKYENQNHVLSYGVYGIIFNVKKTIEILTL